MKLLAPAYRMQVQDGASSRLARNAAKTAAGLVSFNLIQRDVWHDQEDN